MGTIGIYMLGAVILSEKTLDPIINKAALKYFVEPELIKAIIKNESNYNPIAYRNEPHIRDTSWGLMQVLLKTAREVSGNYKLISSELLKPETNIDIGTKYLSQQLKRYGGNIEHAISAYNAGSVKYNALGLYINRKYVNKVYATYLGYKGLIGLPTVVLPVLIGGVLLTQVYFKDKNTRVYRG